MIVKRRKLNEAMAWTLVALWTLVIYVAIPFARKIQSLFSEQFGGRQVFTYIVLAAVAIGGSFGAWFLVHRMRRLAWRRIVWLVGVGACYVYGTLRLRSAPEEALHFVEYGVLALLLVRAFLFRVKDPAVYFCAGLAGLFIGLVDEMIQWMVPRRFWDWRDLIINSVGCVLMLIAVAGAVRPFSIERRFNPRTVRMAVRLAVVLVMAFAFCFMNTPGRTDLYAVAIPGLGFLEGNPSVMTEYGYRHEAPGIGTFYSRLTLGELREIDERRNVEAGNILTRWRDHGSYPEFLKAVPPNRDPFVHEARVHLFRRDHHIGKYTQATVAGDRDKASEHATIAFREQQLVEAFYGRTMSRSTFRIPLKQRSGLRARANLEAPYTSPVSQHLYTLFTEAQIHCMLVLMLMLLCIAHVRLGRRIDN